MGDRECTRFRNASDRSLDEYVPERSHSSRFKRYLGEYIYEASEINIKLLYIPLIQLSVEKERITRPLIYDDETGKYY